jgi:predicted DCC family thiol-disulfide oxidoreductase YuxK
MTSVKNIELRDFPKDKGLILFDGVCNLCNNAVQRVIKNDPKGHFYFASLTWPIAEQVKRGFPHAEGFDSILLFENDRLYDKSSAALKIAAKMKGLYPLMGIFWVVPKPVRDVIYEYVARNRYKWFGKKDVCMIPSLETANRFVQ